MFSHSEKTFLFVAQGRKCSDRKFIQKFLQTYIRLQTEFVM